MMYLFKMRDMNILNPQLDTHLRIIHTANMAHPNRQINNQAHAQLFIPIYIQLEDQFYDPLYWQLNFELDENT